MTSTNATNPLGSHPALQKPAGIKLGIGLTCPSPELAQICGHSGFDMVLIDMEHGPISIESAYRMVSALVGTGAEAWIRVSHNDVAQIKLALDTGATTIVVPMVTTQAEAELAVSAAKYPPQGIRGWGPFRPQYQWKTSMLDYASRANAETRLLALIEHPRAIENIDAILSVEGLGERLLPLLTWRSTWASQTDPTTPRCRRQWRMRRRRLQPKAFRSPALQSPLSKAGSPCLEALRRCFLDSTQCLCPQRSRTI